MVDNSNIDEQINMVDQIRLRLIAKYGATFSGLSIPDQIRVIELVIKLVLGR